jgi:hypothetical protein
MFIATDRAGPDHNAFTFHEDNQGEAEDYIDHKLERYIKLLSKHMQGLILTEGKTVARETRDKPMSEKYQKWADSLKARRQNPQGGNDEDA